MNEKNWGRNALSYSVLNLTFLHLDLLKIYLFNFDLCVGVNKALSKNKSIVYKTDT